jgi:hypothetical protein
MGAVLALLLSRLLSPQAPQNPQQDEYTFQPEPRRAKIDLGGSSGALNGTGTGAAAPSQDSTSCASLQQFANYEYGKRFREGKLSEQISFSNFESADVFLSDGGTLNCAGGEYVRKGKSNQRSCKNVILSYDTRTNTLTYNVQYVYLERGLQPQCANSN